MNKAKILSFLFLAVISIHALGQNQLNSRSKALYIFDIARYVDYGETLDSMANFTIGLLSTDQEFYFDVANLGKTRKEIQGKPVIVQVFRDIDKITYTNLLFVSHKENYNLKNVLKKTEGKKTLLMTEGYEFGSSMFNFIMVDGRPQFEINQEMLEKAGLTIETGLLVQAVKTREDWEKLYEVTSEELTRQLELVEEQKRIIAGQLKEIEEQKIILDSLDRSIHEKENVLIQKQLELERQAAEIDGQAGEIKKQALLIKRQQDEVKAQKDTLVIQRADIAAKMLDINKKQELIDQQEERIKVQLESIEKQKILLFAALFVLLLISVLAYYIYRAYTIKREANMKLEEKNKTITAQKDEIEEQRDMAEKQRDQIAYQKKHITDSIMYARRIQSALLPSLELFSDELEHFVLYKPLDIVSGDFYWVSRKGNFHVVIAADCTGHGVPGAFMSMLGVTMLNEIVNGKGITMPDQVLNMLRDEIIGSLKQSIDEDRVKDGMDMTVCLIDYDNDKLWFAGANNPLVLIRNGEMQVTRGDKMPVAIHYRMNPFTLYEKDLRKGDCIYMFSDGFGDQFGGPRQKKFMVKNLKDKFSEFSDLPMLKQGEKLNEVFDEWKGDNPQVDDVTVIGIRY